MGAAAATTADAAIQNKFEIYVNQFNFRQSNAPADHFSFVECNVGYASDATQERTRLKFRIQQNENKDETC